MLVPAGSARVSAGDRSLYAEWYGSGGPAVVIEVGSTMPGTNDPGWFPIIGELSHETTVLVYDRASLGKSDPTSKPRTLADFTDDLRAVIAAAPVQPPYVLVGGSFGGLIVTDFASRDPQEVAGIVLVDSTHPEHNLQSLPLVPPENPGEPPSLTEFRRQMWLEQYAPLETDEWEGLNAADAIERSKAWNLPDIPLVVLTAGVNEWEADFPPEIAELYEQAWLQMQRDLASLSTRSFHRIVADSDHIIHYRRPDLVIASVRALMYGVSLSAIDERSKLKCP